MRRWIALVVFLSSHAVHAGPWSLVLDPVALHRPLHRSDCPTDDCDPNSLLRVGVTREVIGDHVYVGAAAGYLHLQAIAGARWIAGHDSGLTLAIEVRPTVEVLVGPAIYGSASIGWAIALAHGHRFIVAPAFEVGPFWDRDHGTEMTVIGGAVDLAYSW